MFHIWEHLEVTYETLMHTPTCFFSWCINEMLLTPKKLFIKQVGIVYVSAFGPDLQNRLCIFWFCRQFIAVKTQRCAYCTIFNHFQGAGGCSSNGSDFGDSEEEDGTLDHSLLDDMERVDVEGEVESALVAGKVASPSPIRTPVAASRNKCTNSSGWEREIKHLAVSDKLYAVQVRNWRKLREVISNSYCQ